MPLYEYRCADCGSQFEKMVPLAKAGRIPECPKCNSAKTRKKPSTFASLGSQSSLSTTGAANCGGSGRFT